MSRLWAKTMVWRLCWRKMRGDAPGLVDVGAPDAQGLVDDGRRVEDEVLLHAAHRQRGAGRSRHYLRQRVPAHRRLPPARPADHRLRPRRSSPRCSSPIRTDIEKTIKDEGLIRGTHGGYLPLVRRRVEGPPRRNRPHRLDQRPRARHRHRHARRRRPRRLSGHHRFDLAGRGGPAARRLSAAVLVASSSPLDQFIVNAGILLHEPPGTPSSTRTTSPSWVATSSAGLSSSPSRRGRSSGR